MYKLDDYNVLFAMDIVLKEISYLTANKTTRVRCFNRIKYYLNVFCVCLGRAVVLPYVYVEKNTSKSVDSEQQ